MNLKKATLDQLLARERQFQSELQQLLEKDEWLIISDNGNHITTMDAATDCLYAEIEDIQNEVAIRKASAESLAYADRTLDDLNADLNREYERRKSLTCCSDHLFQLCRVKHLRGAIENIEELRESIKNQAMSFEAFKSATDEIAMQRVGTHCYENYLKGSKTPFIQVLSQDGDERFLPDLWYPVRLNC